MNVDAITNKEFWAHGSGQMPVRLSPCEDKKRYILLDGGLYDFCLDLTDEDTDVAAYYSAAWSSDVKNYIALRGERAEIYNWSRGTCETVKQSVLRAKFTDFLKILNTTSYRTSDDVTPFILGLFSQLRNLTKEHREPIEALNLLFKLLISLDDENLSQTTCDTWGVQNVVAPAGFDALLVSLQRGVRNIKPNLDFILRHGSGPLFETAHREALYFDTQIDLFGEVSSHLGYALRQKYTGVHYTPRYLVRSIVENALKQIRLEGRDQLTILDPACGSGAFLQEVLKQLKEMNYEGRITIRGFDISLMAEQTAKFLIGYESRSQWNDKLKINIRQQDSLAEDWGVNDIVLMNPPFISYELIKDPEVKDRVNSILEGVEMKKRPNMAAAFLYKAVQSLSDNGVIGAVLPSSLLLQEQYDNLRSDLRDIIRLETVAHLGNFVFKDALADTSFILGVKLQGVDYIPLNIWCSNREQSAFDAMKGWRKMQYDNATLKINEHYNIYTPSHFPIVRRSWKVLPQRDDELLKKLVLKEQNGDLKPLGGIFEVRQGVIKGNRDLFEIDLLTYEQLPKLEKRLYRLIVSSQTIDMGYVKRDTYLWYPYNSEGLMIKSDAEFRDNYPVSYAWLSQHETALSLRKGVGNWWELTRSRYELFSKKDTWLCSKRSGGSHSFAIAPENSVVEEGNVFLFKKNYGEDDKYFYLAFFSSSVFQRMLGIFARPLKAGYDLGKVQIKDVPIIDINNPGIRECESYLELVRLGKEYAEGYVGRRDYFDKYVLSFY